MALANSFPLYTQTYRSDISRQIYRGASRDTKNFSRKFTYAIIIATRVPIDKKRTIRAVLLRVTRERRGLPLIKRFNVKTYYYPFAHTETC